MDLGGHMEERYEKLEALIKKYHEYKSKNPKNE